MDRISSSPDDSNRHRQNRTERPSSDAPSPRSPRSPRDSHRIGGNLSPRERSGQQSGTDKASPSGSDGQSRMQEGMSDTSQYEERLAELKDLKKMEMKKLEELHGINKESLKKIINIIKEKQDIKHHGEMRELTERSYGLEETKESLIRKIKELQRLNQALQENQYVANQVPQMNQDSQNKVSSQKYEADPLVNLGQKRKQYDKIVSGSFPKNADKIQNEKQKLAQEVNESCTRGENLEKNILVLGTGGTINSRRLPDGKIVQLSEAKECGVEAGDAKLLLLDEYQKKYRDSNINFDTKILMETLSEDMTIEKWEDLAKQLKDIDFEKYDGIVLTHGSDTLAYTANYLSMMLDGIKVPMFLVSSNYVLTDERANGIKNLKGAVDYISNVKIPGVYVTYHYNGDTKVIYGSRVTQCEHITDDVNSISMPPLGVIKENGNFKVLDEGLFKKLEERSQVERENLLDRIESLKGLRPSRGNVVKHFWEKLLRFARMDIPVFSFSPKGRRVSFLDAQILVIDPHPGLSYEIFNLDKIDAVLHGTYHSGTACTDGDSENLLKFAEKCKERGVGLHLCPIYGDAGRDVYDSTAKLYNSGVPTIMNVSFVNAFAKLLIGYALFKDKEEREKFIHQNINEEFVKPASRLERNESKLEHAWMTRPVTLSRPQPRSSDIGLRSMSQTPDRYSHLVVHRGRFLSADWPEKVSYR